LVVVVAVAVAAILCLVGIGSSGNEELNVATPHLSSILPSMDGWMEDEAAALRCTRV